MAIPAYRLRVFAPRSVDATETTPLTPRAGADHSDPFKVATVQGVTGYQPYLLELPKGRRSTIDPLSKKTDIGSLTFLVGDKRLGTDNLVRWVTAFVGDAKGEDLLKGRRVEVDENISFDPLNPEVGWLPYYTGRIVHPRLSGRLAIELVVHEMTDDLTVNVFVGSPHANVAAYAHQSQLYPLGLLQAYGPFPVTGKAKGHIAAPQLAGYDAFSLTVDTSQPDTNRLIAPRALIDTLTSTNGSESAKHQLELKRLDTGVVSRWAVPRAINWSTSLEKLAVGAIPGVSPAAPPVGTAVEFSIVPVAYPVNETTPLLINDVHPATLIKHLLAGYYGRLDPVTLAPTWSVAIEPTSFAAIEADASFLKWRSFEKKSAKLNATIEAICQESHLAYYPNALGQIVLVDLRRTSTLTAVGTLSGDDLATGSVPAWEPDATSAVSSVTSTYYVERQITDDELPKPFERLKFGEYARDKAPNIPAVKINDDRTEILRVEQFGPRVGDVTGTDVEVDARGLRFALTGPPGPNGLPTVAETLNGQPRSLVIQGYLTGFASELRAPYALGPTSISLAFKRVAAAGYMPGTFAALSIPELPDPASNRRGGVRLALVVGRTEDGPVVTLDLIDAGSSGVAVVPTLAAPATVTGNANAVTEAVTLNAAGNPVQLQVALTAQSVGTRPVPGSALWTDTAPVVAGKTVPLVTASSTATLERLAGNTRVWIRARSIPVAGAGFQLPSSWAFPSGAGYVDLATIPAPSGLTVDDVDGYARLLWTPGDDTHREEVLVTTGGVPGTWTDAMRVQRLEARSDRYAVGPLVNGTAYTVGVRAVDEFGGASAMTTVSFTCGTSEELTPPSDPTPFACSHDESGVMRLDGTYGLAVAATVFPGGVEFVEAVETAENSGVFGVAETVAIVAAVQGDWTKCTRSAPNDGRKRQLAARSLRDPSTPSDYTEAVEVLPWVPLELPNFQRTVGSTELTNVKFTDPDSGHRRYQWIRGSRVVFVWVFDRLKPLPLSADPWPNVTDLPDASLPLGEDFYLAAKPPGGFDRLVYLVPFYRVGDAYKRGPAKGLICDPAPASLSGKLKAIVTNGATDLEVQVAAGASDWPVTANVYADDPDDAPIATFTFSANGTRTKADDAGLGGLLLPQREARHFWLTLTSVAGVIYWAHTSADRDALPSGSVTLRDFSATPSILVDYDDDTDAVRVTTPGGKTKTFSGLAGIGTVTYTVGMALDDASTEAVLGVGATSGTYLVEVQGGGVWLPVWRGQLRGRPAHAPRVKPRAVKNGDGSAEDVFVMLETDTPENVTLRVRVGEGAGAPIYTLCNGAGDATTLYVANGTEVGPAHFFAPAVGSPNAVLNGVPLTRDQIKRYYVQAVGQQSGVSGEWVAVPLSLMEKPYVESFAVTWDDVGQVLRWRGKAGPHSASYLVELDDNAAFSSPITTNGSVTEGGEFTNTQTLSGSNRGKVWYGRATTYNGAGLTGLASVGVVDECEVPAIVEFEISTSESAGDGTLTIVVRDPGGVIDPSLRVKFYVKQLEVTALETATSAPGGGATTGTYTKTKGLLEKHNTDISPVIYLLDGSEIRPGGETFDADKVANVVNLDVATDGPNGTVVATFDSDTVAGSGTGGGRYRIDGGSFTTFDVSASTRVASFTVPLSSSATQLVEVQGKNAVGDWGPLVTTRVPLFAAAGGPTLVVTPTPGPTAFTLTWTATGTVQVSINGASYTTPGTSPISVTRTTSDITYAFKCSLGGQTITDAVTIPSLEKDTVTPDLTVVAGTPTSTQTPFTVSATHPAGGTTPTITVTPTNCSMIISAVTYTTAQTVSSGTVVTAVRPASTTTEQATLKFRATISGGGAEEISRTIPPALNTGPSLELTATPGSTSYSIGYTATGTVQYRVDTGSYASPPSNPFSVSRNSAGGADKVVMVTATLDGQTVTSSVTVPAQAATGGGGGGSFTSFSHALQDASTDQIRVTWAFSGSTTSFELYSNDPALTGDPSGNTYGFFGSVSSPYDFTAGENLSPNPVGTDSPVSIAFQLVAINGSSEVGRTIKLAHTYAVDL